MFDQFDFLDLTHKITSEIPTWSGCCGFSHEIKRDYDTGIRILKYSMHGSCGTHIDAPSHFIQNGRTVANLTLEELIVPFRVINVSKKREPNLQIDLKAILNHENEYGNIEKNTFVIGYTGWGRFWSDPQKYRNPQIDGSLLFPTFSIEAASYLVEKNICGIGIDTLSPDPYVGDHPVHRLLLGMDKYIVENLANLENLTSMKGYVIIMPLKIDVGAEASCRIIALTKKEGYE